MMKYRDIICSAVLPDDFLHGLEKASASLSSLAAAEGMSIEAQLAALRQHLLEHCARTAVVRFLRRHGVRHAETGAGLVIVSTPCEIIVRYLGEDAIRPEQFSRLQAVLSADVPSSATLRCIFVFVSGTFSVLLRRKLPDLLSSGAHISSDEVRVAADSLRVFLTATALLPEELPLFREGRCPIGELAAFRDVVHWGGV
ncbi:MAG TPA: hypothetical protein ENJ29_12995 [Bacteroidetes bacterium]|nr:hypothetical protein [Bacteroidota bacterium]